jgi:hypothetical protein
VVGVRGAQEHFFDAETASDLRAQETEAKGHGVGAAENSKEALAGAHGSNHPGQED